MSSAEAFLTTKLSPLVNGRIYPDAAPADVVSMDAPAPYIVYSRVSTDASYTIHGGAPLANLVGITVYCWASRRLSADDLAEQVMAAMSGEDGCITSGRSSTYDEDTRNYATVIDFDIWEL